GAIEQHGPQLPLVTDTALATELARRLTERVAGTLRGPVVSIGISGHHLAFPGTITLTRATFTAVLEDYLASLDRHGFPAAYVFSAHGGNFAALGDLERATGGRVGQLAVRCNSNLDGFFDGFYRVAASDDIAPAICGVHAGEGETSEMLRVRPELVHPNRFAAGFTGDYDAAAQATLWEHGMAALTDTGVLGDPTLATADRGERYLEALTAMLADDLQQWLAGA
ncbi:MAG: creatininase family protein, partial [Thermomicrobiales bacterium]|nr:creatininase family protein [Thermomicrobiales bacterium]